MSEHARNIAPPAMPLGLRIKASPEYRTFKTQFWDDNPLFRQILGVCSALAVTNLVTNTLVMCVAVTLVTACSSCLYALVRDATPPRTRLLVQMLIIASFVIVVHLFLAAYMFAVSEQIGAYVGHQTPVLAAVVPLLLCLLADGRQGVKDCWPVALATGLSFGITQWISASYISVELTDIIASLVALGVAAAMLRFWQPQGTVAARQRLSHDREAELAAMTQVERDQLPKQESITKTALTGGRIMMALFPYLLVIVVFSLSKLIPVVASFLASTDVKIPWPGLDGRVLTLAGKPNSSTVYTWQWLSSPGSLLLISAFIVALVYRVSMADFAREIGATAYKLRFSMLTIASVLSLAYVMNLSGMTITIGTFIAGAGKAFAFFSPILGWIGTAVTGSDTSANALFATLQQTAAKTAGIDPTLLVAANTAGGVVGKMVSPQNLTIAATAVGLLGRESDILRKMLKWSLGLLLVLCLLVGLQSTPVLSWMLPHF